MPYSIKLKKTESTTTVHCKIAPTHRRSKRFVGIDDFVDEDADDVIAAIMFRVGRAPQQQIPLVLLKCCGKHGDEDVLQDLRLQLLGVVRTTIDVHEPEEDVPLLLDGVVTSHFVLQVRGEEMEGVDLPVEVHAQELEKGQHVVQVVLAVGEEAL